LNQIQTLLALYSTDCKKQVKKPKQTKHVKPIEAMVKLWPFSRALERH